MTIARLIEVLSTLPPDTELFVANVGDCEETWPLCQVERDVEGRIVLSDSNYKTETIMRNNPHLAETVIS